MPVSHTTPGVYIEEIPKFPPSVVAVETAIPAFIGYTIKARKTKANDLLFIPTRINSLLEYENYFGKPANETIIATIEDEVNKAGTITTLINRKITTQYRFLKNYFYYQLKLFFANGGGPCYIISSGKSNGIYNKADYKQALQNVKKQDEPTLLIFSDAVNLTNATDVYELYNEALLQAYECKDRFAIMDVQHTDANQSAIDFFRNTVTGNTQPDSLKYGAAYYPFLRTMIQPQYADRSIRIIHRVVTKEAGKADKRSKGEFDKLRLDNANLNGTELYTKVKNEIDKVKLILPTSAAIAGVYASIDRTRGVWKAPANISLALVQTPVLELNDSQQAALNVDAVAGKSLNVIRQFTGRGTVVWGARTLAGNDNEWRYISVRRFFNMIEESVKKSTTPFVFEPNDANTWTKVRSMIENFLTLQWRQGALQGAKPEQAFFVQIGLGQTMTATDTMEGRMIIEIGMAAVRPAEFIIIRITQQMQQG